MKKAVIAAVLALIFSACSKDTDTAVPTSGQYVCRSMDLVMALTLENESCTGATVFVGGKYTGSWSASTSGHYPKYVYKIDGLTVRARFSDVERFSADMDGVLVGADGGRTVIADGPAVTFTLDNAPLDADGDGVLDVQ